MALAATGIFELNASATASNVNAGYFNPANANMMTDLTTDSNTANTNSPVVSSATYNFVAGDVGHWLFIKSGTNWIAGWYKISSVASNKATVDATIGAAVISNSALGYPKPKFAANTVTGCATVGTPTGGTFTIDYSQGTAAILTATDYTSIAASSTMTSATGGFTKAMIGNGYHQTTTGTGGFGVVGWYEIVNVASGTSLTLDRSPNNGSASVGCTGYIGGALSMNSTLDDDVFELGLAGMRYFAKAGNFTMGETINIAVSGGGTNNIVIEGYNTIRGDGTPTSTHPVFILGATAFTLGANWDIYFVNFTTTTAAGVAVGSNAKMVGCKVTNTSTTADRAAITSGTDTLFLACEIISYRGRAINATSTVIHVIGCYIHDCNMGINTSATTAGQTFINNIISGCVTTAINFTGNVQGGMLIIGNTIYGAENKLGTGISIPTLSGNPTDIRVINNIFTGLVTGITSADPLYTGYNDYNCFYNNTTDVTNWKKGYHDTAVNPTFTSVAQLTGSTATTSGSVLTQSGGDFSTVVAGRDFLHLVSGTGVTAGVYGITAATSTTVTLDIAPGTDATADKVWRITTGRNFAIGTNLKALGTPTVFPAGLTTSYVDIGAAQRQETSSGGGLLRHVGMAGGLNA